MQKCKIEWSFEALNDFEDYVDWYISNAGDKVASQFITVVDNVLKNIKENRYMARMVDEIPELREYVIQGFPYLISYWVKSPSHIIITSFLHQKQKK